MKDSFNTENVLMIKLSLDCNFSSGHFDLLSFQQNDFSEDFEPEVFFGRFDFTEHNHTKGTHSKMWNMIEEHFLRIG